MGTILGMQSHIGFIPTIISPTVVGAVLDTTGNNWGWAFSTLGFGASIGILSNFLLRPTRNRQIQY